MLTEAQSDVEEKNKKKRNNFREHRTYANPAANPTAQTQTQRGMRKYKRSLQPKKASVLQLNERK
jgi:hypothetical protein